MFISKLCTISSLVLGLARAAVASSVLVLDGTNFDKVLSAEPLVMVKYYAPWCGHCKTLEPEYEEAAELLASEHILLAQINCEENEDVCAEQELPGYPIMRVYRGDVSKYVQYEGERKSEGLIKIMRRMKRDTVQPLSSEEEFDALKAQDDVLIVAYLSDQVDDSHSEEDASNKGVFDSVAKTFADRYTFAIVNSTELAAAHGVSGPSIKVYTDYDGGYQAIYQDEFDFDQIADFVRTETLPLFGEMNALTYKGLVERGLPLAYIFYDEEEDRETMKEYLKAHIQALRGKVIFVGIDADEFATHAIMLNLNQAWPAMAIHDMKTDYKYTLSQEFPPTQESIDDFVDAYVAGTLKRSIKSEPFPESNDGPVKVLVGNNFDKLVLESDADVLVEFYAPWCSHCKKLIPTWDQLGQLYENHTDKVIVAKIDATANDFPGPAVKSFPTIRLYPAGDKDTPIDYNNVRDLEYFAQFIQLAGTHQVDVSDSLQIVVERLRIQEEAQAEIDRIKKEKKLAARKNRKSRKTKKAKKAKTAKKATMARDEL